MATESEDVDKLRRASGTRRRQLKGRLFEAALLARRSSASSRYWSCSVTPRSTRFGP